MATWLTLSQRLEHAARIGSVSGAVAAVIDVSSRRLLGPDRWHLAAWYAERLGRLFHRPVRIDGATIHLPETAPPQMAGVLRLHRYEGAERYAAAKFLPRDRPVLELGAGVGAVTCLINQLLVDRARHWVVEANPALLGLLEETRRVNRAGFQVIHGAIAYDTDSVAFSVDEAVAMSRLDDTDAASVRVPALTLAELHRRTGICDGSLVADIEGAEVGLIERESELLHQCVRTIILEVHPGVMGADRTAAMHERLRALGYVDAWDRDDVWVMRRHGPVSTS
jgi:FkbM family methyltransferase